MKSEYEFARLLETRCQCKEHKWTVKHCASGRYGHSLNVYNWTTRRLTQRIDLGDDGKIPLELRFLHDPDAGEGFVGCTLSSTVFRFFKTEVRG